MHQTHREFEPAAAQSLAYRSDIDGLRAIAILAVLFYHTDVVGVSGGYAGVDIFFVVSGYLISSIIAKDIELGRFSFFKFYERRISKLGKTDCATLASAMVSFAPAAE